MVLAAGLAGCSFLAPGGSSEEERASAVAQSPSPEPALEQAADGDDDDEVVRPSSPPQSEPAPSPVEFQELTDHWTLDVPVRDPDPDWSVRPEPPHRLIDYLPESSVLRVKESEFDPTLMEYISSSDHDSALTVAVFTLLGAAELVNSGDPAFFAPALAAGCMYCLGKLNTAYNIYDDGWELDEPWLVELADNVRIRELSGPEHVVFDIAGSETMLVIFTENQTHVAEFAGAKVFHVEMLFDQDQWWVMGVSTEPI